MNESVLKFLNIDQKAWEQSLEHYLSDYEKTIEKMLLHSYSSPYTQFGIDREEDILKMYIEGSDHALKLLTTMPKKYKNLPHFVEDPSNFLKILK